MAPSPSRGPDLKTRLKSKLLSLDDRDLTAQAERELQKLVRVSTSQAEVELVAKELLSGLDNTGTNARRARMRSGAGCAADYIHKQHGAERLTAAASWPFSWPASHTSAARGLLDWWCGS